MEREKIWNRLKTCTTIGLVIRIIGTVASVFALFGTYMILYSDAPEIREVLEQTDVEEVFTTFNFIVMAILTILYIFMIVMYVKNRNRIKDRAYPSSAVYILEIILFIYSTIQSFIGPQTTETGKIIWGIVISLLLIVPAIFSLYFLKQLKEKDPGEPQIV